MYNTCEVTVCNITNKYSIIYCFVLSIQEVVQHFKLLTHRNRIKSTKQTINKNQEVVIVYCLTVSCTSIFFSQVFCSFKLPTYKIHSVFKLLSCYRLAILINQKTRKKSEIFKCVQEQYPRCEINIFQYVNCINIYVNVYCIHRLMCIL